MDNIDLILTIAIPIYSLVVILLGVWLGHVVTMKAFAHVQPSVKEMTKMTGSVTNEPDYFDEAMKDQPDISDDDKETLRAQFEKTGLPMEIFDSYEKQGRSPSDFFGYDTEYPQGGVEEELEKEGQ